MSSTGSDSGPSTRRRRRTGCTTCRIRRVKCDEVKPNCNRCRLSGRTCDGYAPAASRITLAAAVRTFGHFNRVLTAGEPPPPDDISCFDFFRARTAATAGGYLPTDFWEGRVLQVAHSEPAVWTAIVALGALHRSWELLVTSTTDMATGSNVTGADGQAGSARFASFALESYGRALRQGRAIQNPATMLVLSLVLAGVASLTGRWADSRMHVASGQRLLLQIRSDGVMDPETACAAESLVRLRLQGEAFSESTAPYLYHETDVFNENPVLPQDTEFTSLSQAATHLYGLASQIAVLSGRYLEGDMLAQDALREREAMQQIKFWENSLRSYLGQLSPAELERQEVALLALKLHHAQVRAWLRAGISGPETRWDVCLAHFERITSLVSTLLHRRRPLGMSVVSIDIGIVMPLFVTASRCRHPALRRRFITLLHNANRNEGMWNSIGLANAAQNIAMLEEEGLGIEAPFITLLHASEIRTWADQVCSEQPRDWLDGDEAWQARANWEGVPRIPEKQRILELYPVVDTDSQMAHLTVVYSDKDENGTLRTGQTSFKFIGPSFLSPSAA